MHGEKKNGNVTDTENLKLVIHLPTFEASNHVLFSLLIKMPPTTCQDSSWFQTNSIFSHTVPHLPPGINLFNT